MDGMKDMGMKYGEISKVEQNEKHYPSISLPTDKFGLKSMQVGEEFTMTAKCRVKSISENSASLEMQKCKISRSKEMK